MEKDTRRIPRLIAKYVTSDISEEERDELFEWAARAQANQDLLDRLADPDNLEKEMRIRKAVGTHRPLADMKARIERSKQGIRRRERRSITAVIVSAAAVVLLFFGIHLFWEGKSSPDEENSLLSRSTVVSHGTTKAILTLDNGKTVSLGSGPITNIAAITGAEEDIVEDENRMMNLTTPHGGEFKVTLEDGTEVWLNAQSQLRYPETFDGNERRVQLEGEAYFKVAKNTEKPFIVESAGQMVRVMGTEFNINAYEEDASVYTTLVNGSIALKPLNGNGGELVLTPGHQAVFDKDDAHANVHTVDTSVVTSWRTGSFVFENQTLEQIMVILSRWYDFDYEFQDTQLKTIVFMGSVPRYGEFSEVLKILEISGNIKFKLSGKHLVISSLSPASSK